MDLPSGFVGPAHVALARPVEQIPDGGAMPGGCRYEPKWDGVRAIVTRSDVGARVWSRHGTDLTSKFPEIVAAATEYLPRGTVLDGELVVWSADRLDFTALLSRIARGPRSSAAFARRQPASLAVFDLLALHDQDLRTWPFDERRTHLENLAITWRPPLNLSPVTDDPQTAREWSETYAAAGIEGLVIKGGHQPYPAGARGWLKFKRRRVLDVVCGAVIGTRGAPLRIVAGLPVAGRLRIVGCTGLLSSTACRALSPWLVAPVAEHPWPSRVAAVAVFGRFNADRATIDLTLVEPLTVEVSADTAWDGSRFRHQLTFVRARPESPVDEVPPPALAAE